MRFESQRRDTHPAVLVEQVGLHAYGLEAQVVQPLQRQVLVCVWLDVSHEELKRDLKTLHSIPDRLPCRRIVVKPVETENDRLQFLAVPGRGVGRARLRLHRCCCC